MGSSGNGAAIGGLANLAGGIIGNSAAGGDRGHARGLTDEAMAALQGVGIPADLANKIYFQQYQNSGNLTPAQEQAILANPSAAGQVKANPNLVNAQMQALNALHGLSQTGMTSTDRARLNQIQQQAATQAEGQKQAILQNFAQRGMGGSGNELIAKLQAAQNATNQANQAGLNVAGMAQQNALQALGQYSQQAGQMNQQQFGQQSEAAQAQDLLNRFNVQNQLGQQQRNVAGQNQAQMYNLQNAQQIANANIAQQNQELLRQKQAQQQIFQDQMQRGGALSGADFAGSNAYNNMGNQTANQWANIGSGVGNIATSLYNNKSTGKPTTSLDSSNASEEQLMKQMSGYAEGGRVAADFNPLLSPAPQHQDSDMRNALMKVLPMITALASHGGHVPGKPLVKGDSYKNDIVSAKLSPGEFVVPRSVMQSEDPAENAKKMIELHLNCNPHNREE